VKILWIKKNSKNRYTNSLKRLKEKKKYKQMDVIKHFRALGVSDAETKEAIRELIDGGQLIYTYMGGSYIELASKLEKFEKDIFK